MSNVVMLNFTYDVRVKLYSTHLFPMALFLIAPALPRLVRGLVLGSWGVELAGRVGADSVRMRWRRTSADSFPLLRRGFHWVNEFPYSR